MNQTSASTLSTSLRHAGRPVPGRSRRSPTAARIDASSERGREAVALVLSAIALVVVALVTLVVFRLQPLPITGAGSIGGYSAIASAFVAAVVFAAGRCVVPLPDGTRRVLNALDVASLASAHAVIALVTWSLLAEVVEAGFIDALVFGLPSMLLTGTIAAITAYVAFYSATHMNLSLLAVVLAVFMVEGVIASTLTASDPHWWKENLSQLGMTDDASALAFNLTLILAGLIITTLARYATRGISTSHAHGISRVRTSLILIGILLTLVGVFPTDTFYWVHTGFAAAMGIIFAVLVALLPRWIPEMPWAFVALGWLLIATLAVAVVLFAAGYYNLTAFELIGGIVFFAWILLFIVNAEAVEWDTQHDGARDGQLFTGAQQDRSHVRRPHRNATTR